MSGIPHLDLQTESDLFSEVILITSILDLLNINRNSLISNQKLEKLVGIYYWLEI